MKRNYLPRNKDKRYEIYHSECDHRMLNSNVLNGANKTPNIHTIIFSFDNIKATLFQLIGDEQGVCKRDSSGYPISLSETLIVKGKLIGIDEKFERYCRQQIAMGKSKPKEMPDAMFKERLLAEAHEFVINLEIEELQRRLKIASDKEKVISDANVLKNGPTGSGSLKGGRLNTIDGMTVEEYFIEEGQEPIMIINCEHPKAKPYDGYATSDYLQFIVNPWLVACQKQAVINKEKAKKDGVLYENLSQGLKLGTNAPIPSFPDDCVNYKQRVLERTK